MNEHRFTWSGAIEKTPETTTFRLAARSDGAVAWAQRVEVASRRLREHPDLYRQILDRMVHDIEVQAD